MDAIFTRRERERWDLAHDGRSNVREISWTVRRMDRRDCVSRQYIFSRKTTKKEEERCMTIAMVNMISNILHFPSLPRRIAMFEKSIVLYDGLYSPDWWWEHPCRPLSGPQTLTLQGDGKEKLPSHWGCAEATSLSMNGVCLGCSSVVSVSLSLYDGRLNNPLGQI